MFETRRVDEFQCFEERKSTDLVPLFTKNGKLSL